MNIIPVTKAKIKKGDRFFVRVDFNVSYNEKGLVGNNEATRIISALPTIQLLQKKGARIILASHIGRTKTDTLDGVSKFFKKYIPHTYIANWDENLIQKKASEMKNGDVILLPNLRLHDGEESNDKTFIKFLTSLADVYVNEAFSASHRKHASIVGIARNKPAYAGLQFVKEVQALSKVLETKKTPFVVILGGAKFETKLPLIKRFAKQTEDLYVAGALMNSLLRADGYEVGKSLVEDVPNIKKIAKMGIYSPLEVLVEDPKGAARECSVNDITAEDIIVDISKDAVKDLIEVVQSAKVVLWNGPLGLYEKGYSKTTSALLKAIAQSKAYSVIGGGDTLVLVERLKLKNSFGFVSMAGGAMLEFLGKGSIPGVSVLEKFAKTVSN